ncbi:MAG TPA: hypothetical protein VJU84_01330 [Pyrinomonadaceae bacterium]|nr:hypothetical protein [Pyrinomonadaceae bacterium]
MRSLIEKCKTVVVAGSSIVCFIIITDGPVDAQSVNSRASGALRRNERMQRQNEEYERDRLERELATGPEQPRGRRNEADAVQAKQDFEKLQNNYNRIVLAMTSKEGIQREAILANVAEIRKAAARLKTRLALPVLAKAEEKTELSVEPVFPDSILKLSQHIYDFLTNPLFDTPAAYKVDAAKKASVDLEKIIKVSETIGKQSGVK